MLQLVPLALELVLERALELELGPVSAQALQLEWCVEVGGQGVTAVLEAWHCCHHRHRPQLLSHPQLPSAHQGHQRQGGHLTAAHQNHHGSGWRDAGAPALTATLRRC